MNTFKKIILAIIFIAVVGTMLYHGYKQLEAWVNKPNDKEIKDQYRTVGY